MPFGTTWTTTGPRASKPASAPLRTFYVYRAQSDDNYDLENINAGSLAGVLFYLHHEVVVWRPCGLHHNITRILRLKVTMQTTPEVYDHPFHQEFMPFMACDYGFCGGIEYYKNTGWVPGCQQVTWPDYGAWRYPVGFWYSFPGACPSKLVPDKTSQCRQAEPGGRCNFPNGSRTCSWHIDWAGEVRMADLCPSESNEAAWCKAGGKAYDFNLDRGLGCSFWDGREDIYAGMRRVQFLKDLFAARYPGSPEYDDAPCSV